MGHPVDRSNIIVGLDYYTYSVRKTGAATPAPGNFNAVLSPIHCGLKGAILDLEKNKWMGNFLFIL